MHSFLWEHSDKWLKLAQLLGQLGVFLTLAFAAAAAASTRRLQSRVAAASASAAARCGPRLFRLRCPLTRRLAWWGGGSGWRATFGPFYLLL